MGRKPLRPTRIDLWLVDLAAARRHLASLRMHLGEEDLQQSARIRLARSAEEFVLRRAIRRHILGRYCGPTGVPLRVGHTPLGKPYVRQSQGISPLRFSASSRGELAVVGVAHGSDLGVDVERLDPALVDAALLERALTGNELATLRALPPGQRAAAFLASWVQKEALLKAVGWGLQVDPRRLDLPVVCRLSSAWVATAQVTLAGRHWSIQVCGLPAGYVLGVAAEAGPPQIELIQWQWTPPVSSGAGGFLPLRLRRSCCDESAG